MQCSTHVKAENEEKQGLVTLVVCLGQSGLEAAVALQLGHQCELSQLQWPTCNSAQRVTSALQCCQSWPLLLQPVYHKGSVEVATSYYHQATIPKANTQILISKHPPSPSPSAKGPQWQWEQLSLGGGRWRAPCAANKCCIEPMKVVAVCSLAQRANESDSSVQSSGESGPREMRVMRVREGSIPFWIFSTT